MTTAFGLLCKLVRERFCQAYLYCATSYQMYFPSGFSGTGSQVHQMGSRMVNNVDSLLFTWSSERKKSPFFNPVCLVIPFSILPN